VSDLDIAASVSRGKVEIALRDVSPDIKSVTFDMTPQQARAVAAMLLRAANAVESEDPLDPNRPAR
jgi:hypothetical protein